MLTEKSSRKFFGRDSARPRPESISAVGQEKRPIFAATTRSMATLAVCCSSQPREHLSPRKRRRARSTVSQSQQRPGLRAKADDGDASPAELTPEPTAGAALDPSAEATRRGLELEAVDGLLPIACTQSLEDELPSSPPPPSPAVSARPRFTLTRKPEADELDGILDSVTAAMSTMSTMSTDSASASRQQHLDSSLSTVSTMSTDSALDNAEIVSIIPSADDACVSAIPPRAAASNRSPPGMSAPDSPFDASGVDASGVRAAVWAVEEEEEEVVYACRCKLCGRPKRAPASHCPCPRLPDGSAAEQWQPPAGDSGVKIQVRHVACAFARDG